MDNNRKYRSVNVTTLLMFIVIVAAVLWMAGRMQMHRQEMTYTEFSAQVEEDNVTDVYIDLNSAVPTGTVSFMLKNENEAKYIARHEVLCTLEDVLRESGKLLGNKGRFYMVHRPFRLAEILSGMSRHRIEPKRMRLVHPYIDKEPNMVLLEGVKGAHPRMTVEPPLVVYNKDGTYTEELLELYGLESRKEAGR